MWTAFSNFGSRHSSTHTAAGLFCDRSAVAALNLVTESFGSDAPNRSSASTFRRSRFVPFCRDYSRIRWKVPLNGEKPTTALTLRISAVRTPWPATRPAHSFLELRAHPLDVLPSGLRFLHRNHPADPLIARERRNVFPFFPRRRIRKEGFAQIRRHAVHRASRDPFPCHRSSFYIATQWPHPLAMDAIVFLWVCVGPRARWLDSSWD